jgi:hypothetical protein
MEKINIWRRRNLTTRCIYTRCGGGTTSRQ